MTPYTDITILNEFVPTTFPCKPEAPWIKRYGYGIKFTDEIQNDSKIQLIPERNLTVILIAEEKCLFIPTKEIEKLAVNNTKIKIKAASVIEVGGLKKTIE